MSKMGTPQDVIYQEVNLDNDERNMYHLMCYRGNVQCCLAMLNLERVYLKKTLFDQLLRAKNEYRLKSMDVKHGALASSIYLDADLMRRFEEFIIKVQLLFQKYSEDILARYR